MLEVGAEFIVDLPPAPTVFALCRGISAAADADMPRVCGIDLAERLGR